MLEEWEQKFYGKNTSITIKEGDCAIYRIKGETGESVVTRYEIAPGIALVYNDIHASDISVEDTLEFSNIVEINHCREGRIEFETVEGEYLYVKKGDMSINKKSGLKEYANFPQCHYHGVTIEFDMDILKDNSLEFMEVYQVDLVDVIDKFLEKRDYCLIREKEEFEHLFSEIYCVPEKIRRQFYKLKITEIMLLLSVFDVKKEQLETKYFNRDLVASVKEAHSYMLEHLDEKITIDLLSEKHHVSPTNLKKCFREIYGNSIYAYLKEARIHKAAELIKTSELEIGTIAGMAGYDNASKFSKSFKDIIGINPREYRKSVRMEHSGFFGVEKEENKEYNNH